MFRFNFSKLMVILMVVISPSVFAYGSLSTSVGDATALTVFHASSGSDSVAGFYISTIFTSNTICSGGFVVTNTGQNRIKYNFSVPTYGVALNSSTVIGGSALYGTLGKSYTGLTGSALPSPTSNMSVQITMFEDITYQGREIGGAHLLKTTEDLATTACFVLYCTDSPMYTCNALISNGSGSTAYY